MTVEMTPADTLHALLQLAGAIYHAPGAALRTDLESGRLQRLTLEAAASLGLTPPQRLCADFDTLQPRYVALFVTSPAGVTAPPYAGYALDNTLLGESVKALRAFFLHHGFSLSEHWHDLPDHIALLAEAGLLLLDMDRYDEALELTERFLMPWFARFAEVLGVADPDFYGPLTQFLNEAIKEVTCEVAA